jgi:hypothetical protein
MGTKPGSKKNTDTNKTARKGRNPLRTIGIAGAVLAIFALPVGGYALYVVNQLKEVEAQNLRTLAQAAGTLEALVANFQTNVESLGGDPGYACEFQARQTRLNLEEPNSCDAIEGADEFDSGSKITSGDTGLRIELARQGTDKSSEPEQDFDPASTYWRLKHDGVSRPEGEATLENAGLQEKSAREEADAGKDADEDAEKDGEKDAEKDAGESSGWDKMIWSVRFDKVLADMPFGDSMDALLIADDEGRVVEQHPDPAAESDATFSMAGGDFDKRGLAQRGIRVKAVAHAKTLDDSGLNYEELGHGTSIDTVLVAGTGYKMLCQPLVLNLTETDAEADAHNSWLICGLMEEGRALREALEVAPFLTVFLFSLFFFALFLWPIAKILSMSSRERFRFADVYLLLLGTWGALILVVILSVTIDTYIYVGSELSEGLEQLAADIDENFTGELEAINAQLQAFDRQLNGDLRRLLEGRHDWTDMLTDRWPAPGRDGAAATTSLPADSGYPFFASIFWVEPCSGQQLAKGAVRKKNTPKVPVRKRAYFQKVQKDDLWEMDCEDCGNGDARFYLQSDRSITTGEFFAAVSMPSAITERDESRASPLGNYWQEFGGDADRYAKLRDKYGPCAATPRAVAVMSGQPVSVTNPVLAPGVGFAILDPDGNVVFHSDERRAKFENFFEELGAGDRLAGLLKAGLSSKLQSSYRARPHRIYARPMTQVPLSIVTFMDSEILRTSTLESLMQGSMWMLLHLTLYLFASLVYIFSMGRTSPAWMWPYLSLKANHYQWLAWFLVVLLLGAGLVISTIDGTPLIAFCLALPIIPIIAVIPSPWILQHKLSDAAVRKIVTIGSLVVILASLTAFAVAVARGGGSVAAGVLAAALLLAGVVGPVILRRNETRANNTAVPGASDNEHDADTAGVEPDGQPAPERRAVLDWYITVAVMMWAIIAVLPGYGYTKSAIADQLAVLVKYENLVMTDRLIERNRQVREFYMPIEVSDGLLARRLAETQWDVYRFELFCARNHGTGSDESRTDSEQHCDNDIEIEAAPIDATPDGGSGRIVATARLWSDAAFAMPIYNETSRAIRHLQEHDEGSPDARWYELDDGKFIYESERPGESIEVRIKSALPIAGPAPGIITLLSAVLGFLVVVYWCRYGARSLFFGAITPTPSLAATPDIVTVRELLRRPPHARVIAVVTSPADVRRIEESPGARNLDELVLGEVEEILPQEGPVFLTGFEDLYWRNPDLLRARLAEVLKSLQDRQVVIIATSNMRAILRADDAPELPASSQADTSRDADPARQFRDMLDGFFEVQVALQRAGNYEPHFVAISPRRGLARKTTREWAARELDAVLGLPEIVDASAEELAHRFGTRKEALDYINRKARPFYQALWDTCTQDEHLVLLQLAQEGVANPKQADAVHSLLNRGLLARDPVLRVMNQSFAMFASQAYEPEAVKRMELSVGGVHWAHTRTILFGLLVLLLIFLATTQPAAVENLTKFLTGAIASVAALVTLVNKISGWRLGNSGS